MISEGGTQGGYGARGWCWYLGVEEGAGGLEGKLEGTELEEELVGLGALEEAALQLGGVLEDVAVEGVEEEHLVGGDDAADLLEVDDDGALAAEDGGGVDEERVEEAEVAGGELAAAHHGGLVDLERLHGASWRIQLRVPPPRFLRLGTSWPAERSRHHGRCRRRQMQLRPVATPSHGTE